MKHIARILVAIDEKLHSLFDESESELVQSLLFAFCQFANRLSFNHDEENWK